MNWDGWPLERVMVLLTAVLYAAVGVQVWMFHYRQNFHHKVMYSPVVLSPIVCLAGLIFVFANYAATRHIFAGLAAVGGLVGLFGFYRHVKGVGSRVGGFGLLRNWLIGPPAVLPLLLTGLSAIGLFAAYWG